MKTVTVLLLRNMIFNYVGLVSYLARGKAEQQCCVLLTLLLMKYYWSKQGWPQTNYYQIFLKQHMHTYTAGWPTKMIF